MSPLVAREGVELSRDDGFARFELVERRLGCFDGVNGSETSRFLLP